MNINMYVHARLANFFFPVLYTPTNIAQDRLYPQIYIKRLSRK